MLGRRAQLNITWLNKQNSLMENSARELILIDFVSFNGVGTWLISFNSGLPCVVRYLSLSQEFASFLVTETFCLP